MKNLWIVVAMLFLFNSCSQLEPDLTGTGEVTFKSVSLESFSGNLPNGRVAGSSTWKHVFKNQAVMEIKNKVTGEEFKFDYNPNEFGDGFKFALPFGPYTYLTKVSGGAFEKFLPFTAQGEFNLGVANLEVSIQATTDYGLITVQNQYVKSLGIRHGSELCDFKLLPDQSFYFIYAKEDQVAKMEIIESLSDKLIKRDIPVAAYNHFNFFLKMAQLNGTVNFIDLALGVFEYVEEGIEIGDADSQTFTDPRDGQVYKIVKIGNQTWFAENLNYEAEGSWCYDNNSENCEIYGRLYTWEAALEACPQGWHLPSDYEWEILVSFLGGKNLAGGMLKSVGTLENGDGLWHEPNVGASNESGFFGLPGGLRHWEQDFYWTKGEMGFFWSSSELDPNVGLSRELNFEYSSIEEDEGYKSHGMSCRCIKDLNFSVGQEYGGGIIAYILQPGDQGYDPNEVHGLVAAKVDQSSGVQWGCEGVSLQGADGFDIGTGEQNTADILSECAVRPIAASVANAYTGGGFTDWFLPSLFELEKLWQNKNLIGGFSNDIYWSSTEGDYIWDGSWGISFADGTQYDDGRVAEYRVRAVRAF